MKTQLYNITLAAASKKESEKIKVGLLLTKLCGSSRRTIANEEMDLRQAFEIMSAGMHDADNDRLESIRFERTGVEYDSEQGTIAEEFSETIGDLVDVLNMGDFQCRLSMK